MLPGLPAGRAPAGRVAVSRAARLLMGVLLLEVLLFLVSTVPGVRAATGFEATGFDPWLDGWLQSAGYVTAAVLAVLRPVASPVDRAVWA